jgi:hypothetical protein
MILKKEMMLEILSPAPLLKICLVIGPARFAAWEKMSFKK